MLEIRDSEDAEKENAKCVRQKILVLLTNDLQNVYIFFRLWSLALLHIYLTQCG